jgi:sulfite reductase (NADPH) flavoprotein alpha-component
MTIHTTVADGLLSQEQWQQIVALADGLTPVQARWLSGYFAGLDAGLSRGEPSVPATLAGRTLSILYGTETGNARALAKLVAEGAAARGLAATTADLATYKVRALKDEQDMLLIVSTGGEGDPPAPALGFFEFLEGARAPNLNGARFAVLALGDSTYEQYCEAGKRIDARLADLGAERLAERVDCDIDYDDPAAAWSESLLDRLLAEVADAAVPVAATARVPVAASGHDKRNPFQATVLENIRIVGRHSTKETRHVEFDLGGSGLAYTPGDALGFVARNAEPIVTDLVEACGVDGNAAVEIKGRVLPLAEALAERFEITTASPRFLDQWAKVSGADEIAALEGPERHAFLEGHHIADIVRRYPASGIAAADLIAGLRPLQPRLYSLASSQAVVGEEAHITLAPVRYDLHGTQRAGVASSQIADRLAMGDTAPVYIQENPNFRLPADDVPVIMVGPGTGVAPFRAFLQEREASGAAGKNWLFFGERNFRSDFLYQVEMQEWHANGLLTELDVAFSRDGADKVYVQHRMATRGRELYSWLEDGAHLYVCGDATAMDDDVRAALVALVAREGDRSAEAAEDYVRRLTAEHRYHRDVY